LALPVSAQVVGFQSTPVPANTDVRVNVPFVPNAEEMATVDTSAGDVLTLTTELTGTYDAAAPTEPVGVGGYFYVRFLDGNAAGLWATISAQGTAAGPVTTLTLVGLSDIVTAAGSVDGSAIAVCEHYTIAKLFPAGMEDYSFFDTDGAEAATTLIVLDGESDKINKGGYNSLTYRDNPPAFQGWNAGAPGQGDTWNNYVVVPNSHIIIRNADLANGVVFDVGDAVTTIDLAELLPMTAVENDFTVSNPYSEPVTFAGAGAGLQAAVADNDGTVLVFDNGAIGQNKAADEVVRYSTTFGVWYVGRPVGPGVRDNAEIEDGAGIVIRRDAGLAPVVVSIPRPW
jgi:uncharacterized protein (TIGR02597 family)